MKRFVKILLLASLPLMAACDALSLGGRSRKSFDKVFILYSQGFNNLSYDLNINIDSLAAGQIPGRDSKNAIVVFSHSTESGKGYAYGTKPAIYRLFRDGGRVIRDTVGYFRPSVESCTAEVLGQALSFIKSEFPSKSYSMLMSSHGTGWIPPGYTYSPGSLSLLSRRDEPEWPQTKSVGASFSSESGSIMSTEMELMEFAECIPMHMEYIIFDACLMGCVEVAYALKDVCDYMVASPTEVLSQGFVYRPMSGHLFDEPVPEGLASICRDYIEFYKRKPSGSSQSASITLIRTDALNELASATAGIVDAHRSAIGTVNRSGIQRYFYGTAMDSRYKPWYYDIRDIAANLGADSSELEAMDAALSKAVVYHDETAKFFDIKLERCCGLSMYLPDSRWNELNNYYKSLSWNTAAGLVK